MKKEQQIIVVGGGWAGMATAVRLAEQGHKPVLLESARQLGGRARRVPFNKQPVDNGQHLFIGAYHVTLQLLQIIHSDVQSLFKRTPLSLTSYYLNGKQVRLAAPRLPAPLHLLSGLLTCKGLSFYDRWRAITFGFHLFLNKVHTISDISLNELLTRYKQPVSLIRPFWEPLCLAIMNTPIESASAQVFLKVLHDVFLHDHTDSDLLFAKKDLSALLPNPAMDFIEQSGGRIRLGQRATAISIKDNTVDGIMLSDDTLYASHVVLAVPPYIAQTLLTGHSLLEPLLTNLNRFSYEPICTIYLQYPEEVTLAEPMLGLLDSTSQWVFDRGLYDQPGLMAVVISSRGNHMALNNETLIQQVSDELAALHPQWPAPLDTFVVREKRATFSSRTGVNQYRPDNKTPVKGLWLAGDYTNTGYPATLEGAVRSGVKCADYINQQF